MGNKFLSKYPKLCEPKIGDQVVMTRDNRPYWKKGDVGEIIKIYTMHTYVYTYTAHKIDFNNCGRRYWATKEDFELYHGS